MGEKFVVIILWEVCFVSSREYLLLSYFMTRCVVPLKSPLKTVFSSSRSIIFYESEGVHARHPALKLQNVAFHCFRVPFVVSAVQQVGRALLPVLNYAFFVLGLVIGGCLFKAKFLFLLSIIANLAAHICWLFISDFEFDGTVIHISHHRFAFFRQNVLDIGVLVAEPP